MLIAHALKLRRVGIEGSNPVKAFFRSWLSCIDIYDAVLCIKSFIHRSYLYFIYSLSCVVFFPNVGLGVGKTISESTPAKSMCSPPCHRYARCITDPKTGEHNCSCGRPCPRIYSPVCGTDGITYSSECMRMFLVCEKGTDVGLKHLGECKKGECDN